MIGNIVGNILGHSGAQVKGQVVIVDKNVLDFNDFVAGGTNFLLDLLGQQVSLQLVSATSGDPNNGNRGVIGEAAYLEKPFSIIPLPNIIAGETTFGVTFRLKEGDGIPGAVIVKNRHLAEFFLKSITIENYPGKGRIHFDCNSWVYNVSKYSYDRVFFANDTYLPKDTPGPLRPYREDELRHLRGDDVNRQLDEPDRIYSYAYYNDLGNPDLGSGLARPVLGGSAEYPYPRRGKTGRPPTRTDPKSESRFPLQLNSYVPRDERFGHLKMSDFLGYSIKAVSMALLPVLRTAFDSTPNTFNGYDDVLRLYEGGLKLPNFPPAQALVDAIPLEMLKSILTPAKGQGSVLKFPVPQIIQGDKWRWNSDEEFAREMLAGLNPVIIEGLKEFPPTSQLDPALYGDQNSKITEEHIKNNLEGLTPQQAVNRCRLFILNHHDALMPYLTRINSTSTKTYASRTLLFLKDDDTLKPIAIELSLPHPDGEHHGAVSAVYTPSDSPVQAAIWQLAKAFVSVNDFGVHELISHWLRTHAIMEPFVLATNRHLSALHPINKLLVPHYRDTMNINALARQALVNADGIIELSFSFSKYAMELSSLAYKSWNFALQALPADLLHRGMAVEDPSSPNKVRLLIKDYPYAVDGLAIWSAIEAWVSDYCSVYYPQDSTVLNDGELQAWWKEAVEVGHADLKDKPWWPRLDSISSLVQICSTIIWVASAMHAAINFGQYPYGGYVPNRPTISRQFMPEPGSPDYEQLKTNPDKVFFKTITGQLQSILALSVIEILSTHSSDEVYLGQRASDGWTSDQKAIDALKRFGQRLKEVERSIGELNENKGLKNRGGGGSLNFSYTLLSPFSEEGLTGKGFQIASPSKLKAKRRVSSSELLYNKLLLCCEVFLNKDCNFR